MFINGNEKLGISVDNEGFCFWVNGRPIQSMRNEKGNTMKLKVKLESGVKMPTRAHSTDAGLDIYTPVDVVVPSRLCFWKPYAVIDTGVHVEIPTGHVGFLKSKSGLNVKHGLTGEGVIDVGYTGSIVVKLYNHSWKKHAFKRGDKLIQLVILPIITPEPVLVPSLEKTERGDGGFGSTGR